MATPNAFNARATFALSADRLYRVYVKEGALYFIRIGGQGGLEMALVGGFGLLGGLAARAIKRRTDKGTKRKLLEMDQRPPQELLQVHKHNFRLYSNEVLESVIDPPAGFAGHGPHVGRWQVTRVPDGKKTSLQFEQLEDMRTALALLPPLLGARLEVNVQWNEGKKRFEARKQSDRRESGPPELCTQ
jgi:hypothetical protein